SQVLGAPRWPPNPPSLVAPPAEPGRASIQMGGPDMAPKPPSLVAARRSRAAPRSQSQVLGAPTWPPNAHRSSRPGGAGPRLGHSRRCWGPRDGPQTPIARRAPAEPGRASVTVAGAGGPEMAPKP